jgi:Tfp pilus assembly protein PilN
VDANLLDERLTLHRRLRNTAKNRILLLVVAIGLAILALPPLYRKQAEAQKLHAFLSVQESQMKQRLDDLKKAQDSAQPVIQDQQIISGLHRHAHEFLGQITLFLNNVNPNLCLLNITSQVQGGVIQITSQAQASSYKAASEFVALTAKSPNSKETIISSMNSSPALGKDGVAFDLEQKLQVAQ